MTPTENAYKIHDKFWLDLLWLTLVLAGLFGIFLGSYPLVSPDEGRYAEIAREMAAMHQYITPHLNFIKYLEKPPLFYWLQALSVHAFGLSEWAMRFWTACFGVLGCLVTYIAGCKLYNRKTAIYATFILATSPLYFAMGHLITLDMTVSVFITLTLFAFLIGVLNENKVIRNRYIRTAAVFAALAVLTKGLIGIILPGMVIIIWMVITKKTRDIKTWPILSSLLIFLAIALPWHILVQTQNPEFFHFYFIQQQFARYATIASHRYEPFYYYLIVLFIGLMPWTVFLLQALKQAFWIRQDNPKYAINTFLLIWVVAILIFFSLSHSKLIPYILPIFPPIALLIANYFDQHEKTESTTLKISFAALPLLAFLLSVFICVIPIYYPVMYPDAAHRFLHLSMVTLLLTTMLACLIFWQHQFKMAFAWLTLGTAAFLVILLLAVPTIDHRSIKPLTNILNKDLQEKDRIIAYNHYYQDLPFYTRVKIIVVNCQTELDFGLKHQPANWVIQNEAEFWKLWDAPDRVFVVTRITDYKEMQKQHPKSQFYMLGETQRNILLTNSEKK